MILIMIIIGSNFTIRSQYSNGIMNSKRIKKDAINEKLNMQISNNIFII